MSPRVGVSAPSSLGFAPSRSPGLPWAQAPSFLTELGLGGDQWSSNNTEQGSIHVQVTRPGHDAYKSLSLPRTHGDLYEMIVAPQSHPPRALLLGCSLRHAARPSRTPEGPSLGNPGEGPGRLTLLQQDRRGPESRSLGLACSPLRYRKT